MLSLGSEHLREMDTLSGELTLLILFCFSSEKGLV